jgi:hypothetical protein
MRPFIIAIAAAIVALSIVPKAHAKPVPVVVAPPSHAFVPAWWWAGFACPASIILSGIVANFRDNRQLTTAEAWTCGLLYWIPMPVQPQQVRHHH